ERLGLGEGEVAVADPLVEGVRLTLEASLRRRKPEIVVASPCAVEADLRLAVEQDRPVGAAIERRALMQRGDEVEVDAAREALIGEGGVEVAVAEDVCPGRQRRVDDIA